MPRNDPRTRARGWIRGNTKIGRVLDIHVCHHEDRYRIEIKVRSLFQDDLGLKIVEDNSSLHLMKKKDQRN